MLGDSWVGWYDVDDDDFGAAEEAQAGGAFSFHADSAGDDVGSTVFLGYAATAAPFSWRLGECHKWTVDWELHLTAVSVTADEQVPFIGG